MMLGVSNSSPSKVILSDKIMANKGCIVVRFDWWQVQSSGGNINRNERFNVRSGEGVGRNSGRYMDKFKEVDGKELLK